MRQQCGTEASGPPSACASGPARSRASIGIAVFRDGKRKGQSPYDLLGLKWLSSDWWRLLQRDPEELEQKGYPSDYPLCSHTVDGLLVRRSAMPPGGMTHGTAHDDSLMVCCPRCDRTLCAELDHEFRSLP